VVAWLPMFLCTIDNYVSIIGITGAHNAFLSFDTGGSYVCVHQ